MIRLRPRERSEHRVSTGRLVLPPVAILALIAYGIVTEAAYAQPVASAVFNGDAVSAPLTATPGDPARGKAVLVQREKGHCILCHTLPDADVKFAGNVGPPLAGVGQRLDGARIRGRIVDPTKHDPNSVMPAYYRVENLNRVAPAFKGKTALSAQDVEDAVAYLLTLR
jgi:sulfur-oxidizing protein SoxX